MPRSAASIPALGPGRFHNEQGQITLGSSDTINLIWNSAARDGAGEWREPDQLLLSIHSVSMSHFGPQGQWKYLFFAAGNPGDFGRTDAGFNPAPVSNAAQALDAGLVPQEYLAGVLDNAAGDGELAIVQYPFGQGNGIEGTIDPDPYISTVMAATSTPVWSPAGWQDSAITAELVDGAPILSPHLYTRYTTGTNLLTLRRLVARRRLVGRPT